MRLVKAMFEDTDNDYINMLAWFANKVAKRVTVEGQENALEDAYHLAIKFADKHDLDTDNVLRAYTGIYMYID